MIAYDLECPEGHQFEAWFKNLKAFEHQKKRRFIECPQCGSAKIRIVYCSRAIRKLPSPSGDGKGPSAADRLESFLKTHFEDVGERFADEARQVHYGERPPRNIRGNATEEEEKDLRDEGIGFVKIGLPKPPD